MKRESGIMPYLLHLRPLGFPYFGLTYAAGYLLGGGHQSWIHWKLFFLGFFVWVACLNGGTLCFNSYYDRDEGDVAFLDAPPEPPKYLHVFGLLLMLLGFVFVFFYYPAILRAPYLSCVLLSVLYSHTSIRLKNVVGAAEIINMVGYGFVSPFAGFVLTGKTLQGGWWLVFCATMLWNLGGYWITQVYQIPQDRKKGDITFATRFGRKAALKAAFLVMTGALGVFTAAIVDGIYPKQVFIIYVPALFLGVPFLRYWLNKAEPSEDKKMMYIGIFIYTTTGVFILFGMRAGDSVRKNHHVFLSGASPAFAQSENQKSQIQNTKFQKGTSYVSWSRGSYLTKESDASLDYLHGIGVQWVALITTWYQEKKNSAGILADKQSSHTDEEMVHAIKKIKSLGMHVMLKPHVDVKDGAWRGEISFTDDEGRKKWFASYEKFILHFAQLAEKEKVEIFCMGTELEEMTGDFENSARWESVLKDIKKVYHGKLAYAANWTEYEKVSFWSFLDFAGIDAYFPLSAVKNAGEETLSSSFARVLSRIGKWQKKINKPVLFTEIGYRSMDGASVMPWDWQVKGAPDEEEQALLYKVALEGVFKKSWMAGMYFWSFSPHDMDVKGGDTGYTFYGKPAEKILREYYKLF